MIELHVSTDYLIGQLRRRQREAHKPLIPSCALHQHPRKPPLNIIFPICHDMQCHSVGANVHSKNNIAKVVRLRSHWSSLFPFSLFHRAFSGAVLNFWSIFCCRFPPSIHPTLEFSVNIVHLAFDTLTTSRAHLRCFEPSLRCLLLSFFSVFTFSFFFSSLTLIIFFKCGAPWYEKEIKSSNNLYHAIHVWDPVNVYYSRWKLFC